MKTKKMFRKTLAVLLAVCMLVQLGSVSNAVGDDIEFIVPDNIGVQKAQLIISAINGKTSTYQNVAPNNANFTCFFFGHSLTQGTMIVVTHRVRPSAPRCLEETYRVTYCSRSDCDHIASVVKTTDRFIYCCS